MRYSYKSENYSLPQRLLFVPLKDTIIFPYVVAPLFFSSEEALAIFNKIILEDGLIGCVGQRDPTLKDPHPIDLLSVGTVCKMVQLVKLPNKGTKILVEGLSRVLLHNVTRESPYYKADIQEVIEPHERTPLSETLVQSIGTLFKTSLASGKPLSDEILKSLDSVDHPGRLADLMAITLHLGIKDQQEILEMIDPLDRLKRVFHHFSREIQSTSLPGRHLAARRAGVKTVILPRKNEEHLADIPDDVKKEMTLVLVDDIQEAWDLALSPSK